MGSGSRFCFTSRQILVRLRLARNDSSFAEISASAGRLLSAARRHGLVTVHPVRWFRMHLVSYGWVLCPGDEMRAELFPQGQRPSRLLLEAPMLREVVMYANDPDYLRKLRSGAAVLRVAGYSPQYGVAGCAARGGHCLCQVPEQVPPVKRRPSSARSWLPRCAHADLVERVVLQANGGEALDRGWRIGGQCGLYSGRQGV